MIGLGLWMISHNEITLDIWVAFYLYSQNLLNSFFRIMSIWGTVKSSQGSSPPDHRAYGRTDGT